MAIYSENFLFSVIAWLSLTFLASNLETHLPLNGVLYQEYLTLHSSGSKIKFNRSSEVQQNDLWT